MLAKSKFPPPSRALAASAVSRLKNQLDSLGAILEGATPAALHERSAEGKWSAHENLAHLARYHEVFLFRLERILGERSPRLGRYRAQEDPEAARWFELPTSEVVAGMQRLRATLLRRVIRLRGDQLARSAIHPAFGKMPLTLWIEFFLVHEGHHLYRVFQRLREASGSRGAAIGPAKDAP
ncbi:MAG TPA: DinB family protein [Candidatus Acidoferrales bacterium]|nr:DinB family protein [Candidatus Acidoferrales bacterium]